MYFIWFSYRIKTVIMRQKAAIQYRTQKLCIDIISLYSCSLHCKVLTIHKVKMNKYYYVIYK